MQTTRERKSGRTTSAKPAQVGRSGPERRPGGGQQAGGGGLGETALPAYRLKPGHQTGDGGDDAPEASAEMKISPTEAEVIALFVQLSRVIGIPRSYAEIYAMLFVSPKPLSLDDLIDILGVSRGSASQGLRYLTTVGAIQVVYTRGERRIHYVAVAELRKLITRFLNERVVPHLDSSLERIEYVRQMAKGLPADQRGHLESRLTMLHSWQKKSRRFLGVVTKLLG